MEKQTASRSAAIIAAHRAFDSSKTPEERICYDPFARRFLPTGFTVIGEVEMDEETALNVFKDIVPGFHEYFLARTRYIDEQLQKSLSDGLQQLVILGAGYDSRAYRFDEMINTVQIFEVDHPVTQAVKKDKLKEYFQDLPNHVTLVPIDFQKENLETCLIRCGYDSGLKTLFIWEGVTMYIDSESVDKTLQFISKTSGKGSSVIFDYTYQDVIEGTNDRKEAKGWLNIAGKSNEPLLFGLQNNHVEEFLAKRGFANVVIATSEYFNEKYYTGINKDRETTPVLSIVHAEVMD
ncbi:MAG: SAM-dependent methyltransferase [Desulfobulbaceae bacterium]|nr:SAM-dependent methyltransferase [Desulfobulbaceae bacterium]